MGLKLSSLFPKSKMSNLPVIVILGATGTGKSNLAIQLAKKFNGEIISADSMQIYHGLNIITNKVTKEEQREVVHHFISCVDSLSRYTVVDFRNRALPLIDSLLKKKKIPIIVGGTNYYIESLLYDVLINPETCKRDGLLFDNDTAQQNPNFQECGKTLSSCSNAITAETDQDEEAESSSISIDDVFKEPITPDSFKNVPGKVLHKVLSEVDPNMALTLHPNDKRKVIRSLQVYQQYQCCHSEILSKQRSQSGGSTLGGPLRYKNCIMFWIQFDMKVLVKQLDRRVDDMIQKGLLDELLNFHKAYNEAKMKENKGKQYEEGIFQSIGFKEFHNYLLLSKEEQLSDNGVKLLDEGIKEVKLVTRRYAKKQVKWIKNRFLRKPDRECPPLYGLDATDLSHWDEDVFGVASSIVGSVLQGKTPGVSQLPVEDYTQDVQETHFCDICDKLIIGRKTWESKNMQSDLHYKKPLVGQTYYEMFQSLLMLHS